MPNDCNQWWADWQHWVNMSSGASRTNMCFTILFIFCHFSSNFVICHLCICVRRGNLMQKILNQQKIQKSHYLCNSAWSSASACFKNESELTSNYCHGHLVFLWHEKESQITTCGLDLCEHASWYNSGRSQATSVGAPCNLVAK